MTKFAVLIPDRGDRPKLMKRCLEMINRQTIKPSLIEIVDFPPTNDEIDITKRYRMGYNSLSDLYNNGSWIDFEVIFFIENDDFYAKNYFETMLNAWIEAGKPYLFGTTYTYYYHIGLKKGYKMHHVTRSSAMSTMIKPGLLFHWCQDSEPYTDIHLYSVIPYKLFTPEKIICIGIKHGIGKTGGHAHTTRLDAYDKLSTSFSDPEMKWLRENVDEESFRFYLEIF